ncbi:MAG: GAF domain-containing protein [Planctomycetes bacterium]|nr:GAF domain-containing protein [Planctomycetota bacterium]
MTFDWRTSAFDTLATTHINPAEALSKLTRLAAALLETHDLEGLLWELAHQAGAALGFPDCVLYLVEGNDLVQHAAYGVKNPEGRRILEPLRIRIGRGIVGAVARSGCPENVPDTHLDPRYIHDQFDGRSELTVPIIYEGRVIGVLDSERAEPAGFDDVDEAMCIAVATIVAPRLAAAIARSKPPRQATLPDPEALGAELAAIGHDLDNAFTAMLGNLALVQFAGLSRDAVTCIRQAEDACRVAQAKTQELRRWANALSNRRDMTRMDREARAPGGLHVLLLDDDPLVRPTIENMLRALGHDVVATARGEECVQRHLAAMTSPRPFDLLILDLVVPGHLDGFATLQAIRGVDPTIRALGISGFSPVDDSRSATVFDVMLDKPFDLDALREAIAAAAPRNA